MNIQATLSKREYQIAERLAWGQIDKEVANSLGIAHNTVANTAKKIYKKTGVTSRGQLSAWYFCNKYKIQQLFLSSIFLCLVSVNEVKPERDAFRVRTRTSKSSKRKDQ